MGQVLDSRLTSEEEYRNIFEAAGDGLVIYDVGLDSVVGAKSAADVLIVVLQEAWVIVAVSRGGGHAVRKTTSRIVTFFRPVYPV
jgi:hypothetical protein